MFHWAKTQLTWSNFPHLLDMTKDIRSGYEYSLSFLLEQVGNEVCCVMLVTILIPETQKLKN